MSSSHERCILHPQRRVVGICAHCLRERLTCLIESVTPVDVLDGEHAEEAESYIGNKAPEQKSQLPPRTHPLSHETPSKSIHANIKASAEMGLQSCANLEDSLNSALQKVRHAQQQLSFVAQSPYQGVVKVAPAGSPLFSSVANDKYVSVPISRRRSNASESEMKTFPGGVGMPTKKKGSWFSLSKGKSSLLSSPLPQGAGKFVDDRHPWQKSSQVPILAGRKSASDAIGSSCNNYRQAYMADLEAIAEINIGEAAMKVSHHEDNADAHGNSSWISSLFHRRKGPRHKPDAHPGDNATDANRKVFSLMPNESIYEPPKVSIDSGRHSVDGARPNFKQILRKIEARNKQQRVDCSPMQISEYARKQHNGATEDMLGQAAALQKCKSAASARSSISIDVPSKNFRQASPLPVFQNNGSSEVGYDYGDVDRSRSWGKAWHRTLSPLLGLKHHGRRSVHDPPQYQHPGLATPDHTIFKNSVAISPTPSSYLSPLRRSRRAPDAHIQFAQ